MKKKGIAIALALLLGGVGAHKFYLRKYEQGAFYVLFFWTYIPAIIALFEAIYLFSMSEEKFDKLYNRK